MYYWTGSVAERHAVKREDCACVYRVGVGLDEVDGWVLGSLMDGVGGLRRDGVGGLRRDVVGGLRRDGVGGLRRDGVGGLRREGVGGLRRDCVGSLRRDGVGGLRKNDIGDQRAYVVGGGKMEICTETECLWPEHIHLLLEIPKLVLPPST